ncbi:MAG: Stk1 family PASTA domain-containing Ser/Thr kinase [Oscillospiraceae bacterium]|nr:Stk1 family PASTA domain-containing Ser/Thr kinase [Oscillospiraceae bacterium]
MENYIGRRLDGRYEVMELIGVGGMADIFRARDIVEGRTVAVKILKTELAESDDFLRRFRNESKAIALLSHPNIVKIFDVGFSDYEQFIVMEYIDGINLTEYIQSKPKTPWRESISFITQVLKALQHAHDRGIVHRDIKLQNIMLMKDGTIKVMDFGIAHFNRETNKSISEKAIGSVHYISPEQATGGETNEKSDIYSVGVALYEMLTGRKPFDGENPVSIALMHMQKSPRKPTSINPDIPPGLEEIILKAMQKEPSERYQTAGEMMSDIEEFENNPSILFEYKYFTSDTPPKYFNDSRSLRAVNQTEGGKMNKNSRIAEVAEDEYYDYDGIDDDEPAPRRSPFLPILFAVASAFVIITVLLIYAIIQSIGGFGAPEHTMPDLVGMRYDDVVSNPQYRVLSLNPVQEFSPEPRGQIIRQSVNAGRTVTESQSIDIYVSNGPRLIELDDFGNGLRHMTEVRTLLEKQGFRVTIKYEESDEINSNYVIRTEPPARTLLQEGDDVTVYVSIVKEGETTKIPDMLGLPRERAAELAASYKILLTVVEKPGMEEEGIVMEQSIAPDTIVTEFTTVELTVSSGELPTKPGRISFSLVSNTATGNFIVEYYIDGVLQEELTETRNIELNRRLEWEFEDVGIKRYAIFLTSLETDRIALLCEYEFDFTVEGRTAQRTEIFMNDRIFTELREPREVISTTAPETSEYDIPTEAPDDVDWPTPDWTYPPETTYDPWDDDWDIFG